ncbi:MAG: GNAT family N-acetyltransferase [Pseudoalteromonas sp.]
MAIEFNTSRLIVTEIDHDQPLLKCNELLERVPHILTPAVVECLPPHFQSVNCVDSANVWLKNMLSQSRLLVVRTAPEHIIGFLFISTGTEQSAHIGYLLAKEEWGVGFASELLNGFIAEAKVIKTWSSLIAGVDQGNNGSIKLLEKCGFSQQQISKQGVIFYRYLLR